MEVGIAERRAPSLKRDGEIIVVNGTHFAIWEDHVDEKAMRQVFRAMIARLRSRGFAVMRDPETEALYPSLAPFRWVGRKGDLEFHAETTGRVVRVEFFQNLNVENPNGGRYDFDKLNRMPPLMQRQCIIELTALVRRAQDIGYRLKVTTPIGKPLLLHVSHLARGTEPDSLLDRFNKNWDASRFKRGPDGWPIVEEIGYYRKDRDGVPLVSGDVRYFCHHGRLNRSRVWGGINGRWLVVSGSGVWHVSGHELFSCDPTKFPRRFVPNQIGRLEREIEQAMKAKDWPSVARIAGVLRKTGGAL